MSDNGAREGLMDMGKWWFASAVFVLIVVVGLVLVLVSPGGDDESDNAGPSGGETSEVATTPTEGVESEGADSAFVTLPQPTQMTDGYPTHYPQTPEGAAATAAAFQAAGGALEYDQMYAAQKAYVTGQGDLQGVSDRLVLGGRELLGVPASGPVPAGVGMTVELEGVKWREVDDTRVIVALSTQIDYTTADGTTQTVNSAGAVPIVWKDGRWWAEGGAGDAPPEETYLKPGTPEFEAAGWRVVRNNDWLGGTQ
ncbi:hypothetical protein [Nocardioides pacificus]